MKKNMLNAIKNKLKDAPDVTYKTFYFNKENMTLIFSNSVSSQSDINDFILRRIDDDKLFLKDCDLYSYIKNFIPNNNIIEVKTLDDATYFLFSGFTIFVFSDNRILAMENKANIYSSISKSENEKSLIGPSDAFCENYQFNMGMIRRRLKTSNLKIKENKIGTASKTIVGLFYLEDKVNKNLLRKVEDKLKNIKAEYIGNSNYVLDAISDTNRFILPTNIVTERPDLACQLLLEGRIMILCENTNKAIIIPCMFIDFFKNPDDYYEKSLNVFANRIIRIVAMILALLTPAIYISLMAFNQEAIPSGLLINFSIQKDGVPFSTVFEILAMSFMFQILRESDTRFPGAGGSSISIVGALVLGQAAVEAGIVSPITIIIVAISSVASLAFTSAELINSIRWWQFFLIILASLFGFIGVMFGIIIMITILVSETSCNKAYSYPFEPFNKNAQKDAIISEKKVKFNPQNIYSKEDNNENNI